MKHIIRLVLAATAIFVAAVVFRVVNTVFFEGIQWESFTIYGGSRWVECSGEEARSVICDMLDREPDLLVESETRTYKNGDVLYWKLTEDGDHVCTYRVAYDARFLSGMHFSWTVKDIGPCPLESL